MKVDVHQSIQRKPECIAWRGPIFALGTKGGIYINMHYSLMKKMRLPFIDSDLLYRGVL